MCRNKYIVQKFLFCLVGYTVHITLCKVTSLYLNSLQGQESFRYYFDYLKIRSSYLKYTFTGMLVVSVGVYLHFLEMK